MGEYQHDSAAFVHSCQTMKEGNKKLLFQPSSVDVHAIAKQEKQAYEGNESTTNGVGGMQVYHVLELRVASLLALSSSVVVVVAVARGFRM